MIVDYHMHLRAPDESLDHRVEAIEPYVERAFALGIDEIGFAEHIYYFEQTRALWSVPYQVERCHWDLDDYVDAVLEAKRQGMPVKLGPEVDYQLELEEETAALLAPYPWDFLLGSVHFIEGFSIDGEPRLVDAVGPVGAWARYWFWLARATSIVDVLAHPDLIKIFGDFETPEEAFADYETLASACQFDSTAFEISTAGLHKPVGELYPALDLLETMNRSGVPITLASDAHQPDHVGRDFDRAVEHARAAGYETVTVFEGRRARQEPLG
jgi:histidinol-phosphatase (PHP family)